jgi:hypothetical protein
MIDMGHATIDHAGALIDYRDQTTRVILDYKRKLATIYRIFSDGGTLFDWAGTLNEFKARNAHLFREIMLTAQ